MKLFLKKSREESLHTLDEKEIQKRLYGKYHRDAPPKAQSNVPGALRKIEISSHLKPAVLLQEMENSSSSAPTNFIGLFQKFPWKFAGILTAALITTIVLLQLLSFWFSKLRIAHHESRPEKVMRSALPAVQLPREIKKSQANSVPTFHPQAITPVVVQPNVSRSNDSQISLPRQRYYAVQICTYQREEDSAQLVAELKRLNFHAFFRRSPASQPGGPTHYEVFLSKEETYAAANARLNEFRKTNQFQKFSDSFIRSL